MVILATAAILAPVFSLIKRNNDRAAILNKVVWTMIEIDSRYELDNQDKKVCSIRLGYKRDGTLVWGEELMNGRTNPVIFVHSPYVWTDPLRKND